MSLTFDFRNRDSSLVETMLLHSADNCFNIHLASSDLSSFTRYAAEAISFHVPRRSARPSSSSAGCSLRLKLCYVSVAVTTDQQIKLC